MNTILNEIVDKEYKHGFVSNIDSEILDKGLNVKTIQEISKKKNEPDWLLDFRIEAFEKWLKMFSGEERCPVGGLNFEKCFPGGRSPLGRRKLLISWDRALKWKLI